MKSSDFTDREAFPCLNDALTSGDAWLDGDELVGRAKDGTVVQLGCLWDAKGIRSAESYLSTHPTPDTW